jgi:hypothetical protein
MGRRHPDVDDREIGTMLANELHELRSVAGLGDHIEARPLEQARHTLAE